MSKNKKICLAASAGGHLTQLLRLVKCCREYDTVFVSTSSVVASVLSELGKTYIIGECNRIRPFKSIKVLIRSIAIIKNEKPDYILSTGSGPCCILCLTAKIFGARVIWVDSIANIERLSLSGKIIRPFADLFLTQWPELADVKTKIEFQGTVI